MQERQLSLPSYVVFSPGPKSCALHNFDTLCLVELKRRTSMCVVCKRDNSHFLCYVVVSPEAEILCRL